jgi:hypothetical protein
VPGLFVMSGRLERSRLRGDRTPKKEGQQKAS